MSSIQRVFEPPIDVEQRPAEVEQGFEMSSMNTGNQILQQINDEQYICGICLDSITTADIVAYKRWHCTNCHVVYHYDCIGRLDHDESNSFKCPNQGCSALYSKLRGAQCWCGERAEACAGICLSRSPCIHGEIQTCQKPCHPGPCDPPCVGRCAGRSAPRPRGPSIGTRMRARLQAMSQSTRFESTFWNVAVLVVVNIALAAAIGLYTKWKTQAYKYPRFEDYEDDNMDRIGFCVILVLGLPVLTAAWTALPLTFGLESSQSRNKGASGVAFLLLLLNVIVPGALTYYLPSLVFQHQMKDSCHDLDTRIDLDTEFIPGFQSRFPMLSLNRDIPPHDLHLASRIDLSHNETTEFQFFYRLTGHSMTTPNLAVDIDISNHLWRIVSQNTTDATNRWLAYEHRHMGKRPFFPPIHETVIDTGSFSPTGKRSQHLVIPALDIRIPDFYNFRVYKSTQPFLRVYSTLGLNNTAVQKLMRKKWSRKNEPRVMMRTMGHSLEKNKRKLELCIREHGRRSIMNHDGIEGKRVMKEVESIDDRSLVPIAIVAAYRMRREVVVEELVKDIA